MNYIDFPVEYIYQTFKEYLFEVNYGSMEKDTRIATITDKLKADMIATTSTGTMFGTLDLMVVPRSKFPTGKQIQLKWVVKLKKEKHPSWFCEGGFFDRNQIKIGLNVMYDTTSTVENFVDKLHEFLYSADVNRFFRHEVKHLLDFIDGKYINDKYYSVETDSPDEDKVKYYSQNREIEAHLVSVISDLERIKREQPNLSIEGTMFASKEYDKFMKYLIPSKRNKYRNKILYYWFGKHDQRRTIK